MKFSDLSFREVNFLALLIACAILISGWAVTTAFRLEHWILFSVVLALLVQICISVWNWNRFGKKKTKIPGGDLNE